MTPEQTSTGGLDADAKKAPPKSTHFNYVLEGVELGADILLTAVLEGIAAATNAGKSAADAAGGTLETAQHAAGMAVDFAAGTAEVVGTVAHSAVQVASGAAEVAGHAAGTAVEIVSGALGG